MSAQRYTYLVVEMDFPVKGGTHICCTFGTLREMVIYVNWHVKYDEGKKLLPSWRLLRMRNGHEDSEHEYDWEKLKERFEIE